MDGNAKRKVNKKKRIYKAEGKSERYLRASKESDEAVTRAKKIFFDKILEKCKIAKNSRQFYSTVKLFSTKDTPPPWNIYDMFPGEDAAYISEKIAEFFNAISQEYIPLANPSRAYNPEMQRSFEIHEVAARLRSFKKPKSMVHGDINPTLVTQFAAS